MLWLTLEPETGDNIYDVAQDVVRLASLLGVVVEVEFNGRKLRARPEMSPEQVVAQWDDLAGR